MRHFITYFRRFVEGRRENRLPDDSNHENFDDVINDSTIEFEITDEIDLHTFAPRDVPAVVRTYLNAARARGLTRIRIVHGKGKGVQRAVVHRILAETPFVVAYMDAPHYAGGWGATVAIISTLNQRGFDD